MAADFIARVLLIEDEPDVRESYIDMLTMLGYKVDSADNGVTGLEKLQNNKFDIVITDLNMPVMNGMEALRQIKKKDTDTEVIVITGFATIENAIGAMKQGAFDYITKPVSMEHVKIVLSKCMQRIQARRENKKLKTMNAQLSELNELKDKFITITNHEMRTPLAVLKGYLDLMDMELEDHNNDDVTDYLKIIGKTVDEMVEMIDDMHNLSNLSKNRKKTQKTLININELVNEIYDEMHALFKKRDVSFMLSNSKQELSVLADRKELKRAIRELVQNALKFTNANGKVNISVSQVSLNKEIFITISDTGIGIPNDKLDLIFEPFYEVQDVMHHSTSKTGFMGSGIGVGLSLSKEIVESFGGEIVVESTPGKGSVFTIILSKADTNLKEDTDIKMQSVV
ncbi:MAG: response regulator [Calditrichaceae bacterium]|nr:response regulator [Calditrichaceae bacterium]